jgi:hypothetical protein
VTDPRCNSKVKISGIAHLTFRCTAEPNHYPGPHTISIPASLLARRDKQPSPRGQR